MATIDEPNIVTFPPGNGSADAMVRNAGHQLLQSQRLDALPWFCTHESAPEDFLLELCDLGLYLHELGHRKGPRKLLERLADQHHYPEAILTLAKNFYSDPNESTVSFASFLARHADCRWMFESLARLEPSSSAKADAFLAAARNRPDAAQILQMVESHRFESEAETATDPAVIERLYATNDPRVWRALASNRSVPRHLLEQLTSVAGVRSAAEIRDRARRNIAPR
jgi:hypothetical protein